jgi:ATP-dependent DNA helicase RecQ
VKQLRIASIAKERAITESTVYSHLEQAVRYRLIEISCLATPAQIERIAEARASLPGNDAKLKPLFEVLNEEFSYGLLKCVITWLDRQE